MRRICPVLLLLVGLFLPSAVLAKPKPEKPDGAAIDPPRLILIIRHAEKPDDDKDEHLSAKGQERAEALVRVVPEHFAKPDFIFATHKSKNSVRPIETVTKLSAKLEEPIKDKYAGDEFVKLARKLLTDPAYSNKVVLICWHHGTIPELARSLGVVDCPERWDSKVFDRVWQITFKEGKAKFADLPQKALSGDSAE